jgi:hypothetical protein
LAEAKIDRLSGVEDNSRFVACASGGCGFKRAKVVGQRKRPQKGQTAGIVACRLMGRSAPEPVVDAVGLNQSRLESAKYLPHSVDGASITAEADNGAANSGRSAWVHEALLAARLRLSQYS